MQSDRIRWWPLYHDDQECIGKIQLYIGSTITNDETNHVKVGVLTSNNYLVCDLLVHVNVMKLLE